MRTFIAIELGAALCARLEVELRRLARLAPDARWVRPDSLHLTLAFLGEMSDAAVPAVGAALAKVASRNRPLSLRARGSGTFGPLDCPKVLWAGLAGDLDALGALQRAVAVELLPLGLAPDHAVFEPHVTLARASNPRGDAALSRCADALRTTDFGEFAVRELALFESQTDRGGMRYIALARHPLGAPEP
ncbi:RNA 2',3'-cyclic phosphodiesterase [Hyalangium sp.]|uniref:RNA 2',3'-cyclic phosphodiesterase n=1 Tax=Hyalangium sp. TaxID=2028555 RepID=UPI002D626F13|nr:RNA 2',3'-cyclic phosphodiesterase [Hyalangium sp.]HYI01020.1 RNA 2',3'-cyclic phosphodiesterase [Hyalangium sp.]